MARSLYNVGSFRLRCDLSLGPRWSLWLWSADSLGLQADQWNDRRVGNQLETDDLQRLYTDWVAGLEAQSADIDLLTRRLGEHATRLR